MSRTVLSSEGPLAAAITRVSSCTVPACCSAFMWSTEKGALHSAITYATIAQTAVATCWREYLNDWKHPSPPRPPPGLFSAM